MSCVDGFAVCNGTGALLGGSRYGGGFYCASSPVIANDTIRGNAADYGGGMYCTGSSSQISNSTIDGNTASISGGGIYTASSSLAVTNSTISGNRASSGAGLYSSSSTPTLANCILWGNVGSAITNSSIAPVLTYSDVQGGYTGTGNINLDPKFVRNASPGADGMWGTADDDYGDLRLQAGSPCIDAGSNAAALAAGIFMDLDGHGRFFNDPATPDCRWAPGTCGTTPIVDIGAYEFIAGDYDRDGDLDADDLAVFLACMSGPSVVYTGDCRKADLDGDGDVDMVDFGIFQRCYSGANNPVDPNCAN